MKSFTVKNEGGQTFEVDHDKLNQAEADGFLPVVSNGKEAHRVSLKDFPLAAADGYKPVTSGSDVSNTESAIRGAVQGIPFVGSYADEATGALESAAGSLGIVPDKTYKQARDESRANYESAREDNPVPYYSGMAATSLPLDAAKIVPGLGQGLGAVEGGIYGLGASDADLTEGEFGQAAVDTGVGAGIGFTAPKVLGVIGKKVISPVAKKAGSLFKSAAEGVSEKLSSTAEKLAENATGATGVQASKFREGAGRELLDRGLVKFGDDPAKIAERAGAAKDAAGEAISSALKELDDRGVTASVDNVVSALNAKVSELNKAPGNESVIRSINNEIDNLIERGSSDIPLSSGEVAKRNYQDKVNYFSSKADQKAPIHAADAFRNEVESAATKADPKIGETFKAAKDTYGLLAPIEEAASKRANQLSQHPAGGFNDMASGVIGGSAAGVPGTILGIATKRTVLPRVSSAAAVTTDKISKIIERQPERLGKYLKPLQDAASRGGNALGVTHYLLQSIDPEYQKLMQDKSEDSTNDEEP